MLCRALACEAHTYFRSSLSALLLFFDYCYFYWDTQRESLPRRVKKSLSRQKTGLRHKIHCLAQRNVNWLVDLCVFTSAESRQSMFLGIRAKKTRYCQTRSIYSRIPRLLELNFLSLDQNFTEICTDNSNSSLTWPVFRFPSEFELPAVVCMYQEKLYFSNLKKGEG